MQDHSTKAESVNSYHHSFVIPVLNRLCVCVVVYSVQFWIQLLQRITCQKWNSNDNVIVPALATFFFSLLHTVWHCRWTKKKNYTFGCSSQKATFTIYSPAFSVWCGDSLMQLFDALLPYGWWCSVPLFVLNALTPSFKCTYSVFPLSP